MTILNGLLRINNFDDDIKTFAQYVERVSALWITLKCELDLSEDKRMDAHNFISRLLGQYIFLMQQGPRISGSECETSMKKWNNQEFKSFSWNNQYEKTPA